MSIKNNYPSIRPTLFADFASSKSLPFNFKFRRTGNATYVDSDGLIKTSTTDSPRFTHDPVTKQCLGLLIEPGSQNKQSYSIITTGNGWSTQATTTTDNIAIAPDGTNTATKLTADASGPSGHSIFKLVTTGANNNLHTFSAFVKSAGYNYGMVYVDTSGGNIGRTVVNFTTGEVTCVGTNGIGVLSDFGAEPYGNGWYRIWVAGRFTTSNNYYCHVDVASNQNGDAFTGDGTNGILMWGAQLESSWLTSYIPTNGSQVTQNYDYCQVEFDNTEWYNNRNYDGSWIIDARAPYNRITTGTNHHLINAAPAGDANQSYQIRFDGYDRFNTYGTGIGGYVASWGSYTSIVDQWNFNNQNNKIGWTPGERFLIALGLQTNNVSLIVNGKLTGNDTGATLRAIYNLQIGGTVHTNGFPGQPYSGVISKILYYPERLSDTVLLRLTDLDNN